MIKIDENMTYGEFCDMVKGNQCELTLHSGMTVYIDPGDFVSMDTFQCVDMVLILDQQNYNHYFKDVSHLGVIDVYRVLDLFKVTDPCAQHSIKKLLCAGERGSKEFKQDIIEARDSINRLLQMLGENANKC